MLGRQDSKVSLFLSGISVTKSMVGVGILGLVKILINNKAKCC